MPYRGTSSVKGTEPWLWPEAFPFIVTTVVMEDEHRWGQQQKGLVSIILDDSNGGWGRRLGEVGFQKRPEPEGFPLTVLILWFMVRCYTIIWKQGLVTWKMHQYSLLVGLSQQKQGCLEKLLSYMADDGRNRLWIHCTAVWIQRIRFLKHLLFGPKVSTIYGHRIIVKVVTGQITEKNI